uniref:Protein root UVB sensitive/RUS domain-containing protein n=1 Tax=Rhizophora mucronata TaxID=61149 RepID=A0A2P2KF89_RHIMU
MLSYPKLVAHWPSSKFIFNFIAAILITLCVSLFSSISFKGLFRAIGVGGKSTAVNGATFQWFLKDLTGILGGILLTVCILPGWWELS